MASADGASLPKLSHAELEESSTFRLDWGKLAKVAQCGEPVVPVAVQHADTNEVLIVAFANELALLETFKQNICVLFSTSRKELWIKGATSGDYLDLVEVRCNCEQNSLLYLVRPRNTGACHTKGPSGTTRPSCYYRRLCYEGAESGSGGTEESGSIKLEHLEPQSRC